MALIFLDLDGTLIDPARGILRAVRHALNIMGVEPDTDADLTWLIGPPLLDSFDRLGVVDPARALALYREHYAAGGMFDATVYPDIPEALTRLAEHGHTLALATAKPHVFARRIVEHFDLARHLSHIFGPELDGTRNDKGALLGHALAELCVDGSEAVMIGDRSMDRDAARAVGARFIGASWGYGTAGELAGAASICDRPDQLVEAVEALAAQ